MLALKGKGENYLRSFQLQTSTGKSKYDRPKCKMRGTKIQADDGGLDLDTEESSARIFSMRIIIVLMTYEAHSNV